MSKKGMTVLAATLCITAVTGTIAFASSGAYTEWIGKETVVNEMDENEDNLCGKDESTWSPFTDCESLDDVKKVAGFEISAPVTIEGYSDITYAAMVNELIQIEYSADENHYICIRKGIGSDDISGDYNVYKEQSEKIIDERKVIFKGNDGTISLATWTDGEYSYSIMIADLTNLDELETGISEEAMSELVQQVK